ncbi:patatin-like phospholipase family protein [Shewanella abyssi]|uniref:patatin-like phospholipase family protein n=1 Tax=Shewanella abyssi TaxID=311789 RepID=UPI00200FE91C|nr:patatin-like phospholipase family protein [Shewanella abyssi]MCL1049260.1 patatin-like phospholipase family protein [Shewanella abyssi]MCL1049361.1 patatin-like phospholipase family protein [Shewanella abyssi]
MTAVALNSAAVSAREQELLLHADIRESKPVHGKIGLALSGGGAKGAAHVGVLRYLESQHIRVDYIAGTSIGAYVGGLYALGYSVDDIERIMLELDWVSGFDDTVPRTALNYHDKQDFDRFNLPFEFGSLDGEILLPQGVLRGQSMANLYIFSAGMVPRQASFDDLAIPFKAISTDIATGQAVVLDSGNLLAAMQASASVPGILQPIEIDGKYLTDGGMVSNMPADTVREMGADIVIAIDIGAELAPKEELQDSFAILSQLSTMMTRANAVEQVENLQPQDILIRPDISLLGTTDFSSMPLGFEKGEQAALAHADRLIPLQSSAEEFAQYQANRQRYKQALLTFQQRPIDRVIVVNNSHETPEKISAALAVNAGDSVNTPELVDAIDRVYALNSFERVEAEIVMDEQDQKTLLITANEKSWGPNFFDIGFSLEEDFTEISDVKLDLAYTMNNVGDSQGQLRFEFTSGKEKRLATEYRLQLDPLEHYYWKNRYQYSQDELLYFWDNQRSLKTLTKSHNISSSIGINLSNDMIIELGIAAESGNIEGPSMIDLDIDYKSYSGFVIVSYDSLDSYSFPSRGSQIYFKGAYNDDKLDSFVLPIVGDVFGDTALFNYEFSLKHARSLKQHTLISKLKISGTDSDEVSLIHTHKLGGFLNLSGMHKNALVGSQLAYGSLVYQYRINWQGFGGMNKPLYLGVSAEAGNVWQYKDQRGLDDLIYASSIFIGTETEFGPAVLGFGIDDLQHKTLYLTLGRTF